MRFGYGSARPILVPCAASYLYAGDAAKKTAIYHTALLVQKW